MKIPKTLHYVWVGGNPIPNRIKEIMDHNKKILGSKWKTKVWTEKNFDIESNPFTKYWYEKKQWAFVSDYIRSYAVYKEGGFYIDTDIVLSKSLDEINNSEYVASRTYVVENTMSIFGAPKGHKVTKTYMETMKHPNLINKPPKIMSTDIHTYALRKHFDIEDSNINILNKKFNIYREDILQIKLDDSNVAIHEHHDNWKGTSDLKVSPYYQKKIDEFNSINNKKILKLSKKRNKMINKIERLLTK